MDAVLATLPAPVAEAPKVQAWLRKVLQEFTFDNREQPFSFVHYDMFGPNLGFAYLKSDCVREKATGNPVPGIAFIRGHSVAVLLVVEVVNPIPGTATAYVLLTQQPRFPAANGRMVELVAGMQDGHGTCVGAAFGEVQQETSITLDKDALIPLGTTVPSGGGCDEEITLYMATVKMTREEIEAKRVGVYGVGDEEKEYIRLTFVDKATLGERIANGEFTDAKLQTAFLLASLKQLL